MAIDWDGLLSTPISTTLGVEMTYTPLGGDPVAGYCVIDHGVEVMGVDSARTQTLIGCRYSIVGSMGKGDLIEAEGAVYEVDGAPDRNNRYWITVPVRRIS